MKETLTQDQRPIRPGLTWHREKFRKVNEALMAKDLPQHVEPETLPHLRPRNRLASFPYSFLHHFRRFKAYATDDPSWKPEPFPKDADPAHDHLVEEQALRFHSHLLCHSDCEGYYVPVEFDEPIFADEQQIPGGMLGSSHWLMRELLEVAPYLGISVPNGILSDAEAERINAIIEVEVPFWIEMTVWLSLFEAARLSIEHRTAICFT